MGSGRRGQEVTEWSHPWLPSRPSLESLAEEAWLGQTLGLQQILVEPARS